LTVSSHTLCLRKKRGVDLFAITLSTATFSNFYVSHSSATTFVRSGKKYYICFI